MFLNTLEKYFEDVWKDLKNHQIERNQQETAEMQAQNFKIPWFGDAQYYWNSFKEKCPSFVIEQFPVNMQRYLGDITRELHQLLPKTDLVKAFLPVLLTSYTTNRTSNLFELLDQGEDGISLFEKKKEIWLIPPLKKTYKKLNSKDCRITNIKRILPVYLKAIQFFLFLQTTSHICDISSSFYVFEKMTGYLHLLGADARYYIKKLEEANEEHPFYENRECDLKIKGRLDYQIKKYVDDTLKQMMNLKKRDIMLPFDYFIFLYNLKCELSSDDNIVLDENDPLEKARQFDLLREEYLNGNYHGLWEEIIALNK